MPDYAKTIIYRLVCKDTNIKECYIGSTTNMTKRKQAHKSSCNNETSKNYNDKKYIFIRNNGGFDNWSLIMIEEYPCENNLQAHQRERHWTEFYSAKLNMIRSFVDAEEKKLKQKEYRQQHADKIKLQKKEYYQTKTDEIKLKQKEYRQQHAEYQKDYRQQHADELRLKKKEYRQQHSDELKLKQKEYRQKQKLLKCNKLEEKV